MFSGGISDRAPPGTMPNPEVKPVSADGTVWGTYGRVGHCQKTVERRARSPGSSPGLLAPSRLSTLRRSVDSYRLGVHPMHHSDGLISIDQVFPGRKACPLPKCIALAVPLEYDQRNFVDAQALQSFHHFLHQSPCDAFRR